MYCKFCSTQIDDDSLFCESCGRQVHAIPDRVRKAHPQRKGRYRKRKKAVCLRTGKLLVVFMLIIVTFFICSTLFSGQTDPEEKNTADIFSRYGSGINPGGILLDPVQKTVKKSCSDPDRKKIQIQNKRTIRR